MHPIRTRLARAAGVLLGAGLAIFLLAGARPTTTFSSLPARASVVVGLTGELGVIPAPPAPLMSDRAIVPGATPVRAPAVVRNQTGTSLAVAFRATAAARDLDGLLRVRLTVAGRTVVDTTLQGLRGTPVAAFTLAPGATETLEVELAIPATITDGYQGRSVAISLVPVLRADG